MKELKKHMHILHKKDSKGQKSKATLSTLIANSPHLL